MINLLNDIKQHILSSLDGGDILFIVPPFTQNGIAVLAPHILQSLAEEAGYKTEILYANMLLASLMEKQMYSDICYLPTKLHWMMLGERLFARSAYGLPPLGEFSEMFANEVIGMYGDRQKHIRTSHTSTNFTLEALLALEELCTTFVDDVVEAVATLEYKIIGGTSMLEQTNCSIAILNRIKKIRPATLTLIGGTNCEGAMAEGIASLSDSIDYVFSGESEASFKMFLKNYSKSKLPPQRIIRGEPLQDLNTLACPDYNSFFTQRRRLIAESTAKQMTISYETSRGCWWGERQKCSFCGFNGAANRIMFRQKAKEKVISDFEQIMKSYPVTDIMMTDNIIPNSYYKKLLSLLSEEKGFPAIWYEEKANLKLQDLIQLKEARINSTQLGIESLSTGLLKLMNKGISAKQNLLSLRNALSVKISAKWYLLWGFPGDKLVHYMEMLALLPLIRHLQPPLELVHLRLVRFSSYVENSEYYQVTNLQPLSIYKNIYPDWAEREKLSFYFTGEYPCEAHENPKVIQELANEIEGWKECWQRSHLQMSPFNDDYLIYDNRDIHPKSKTHLVNKKQAQEIMRSVPYTGSENLKWAVAEKLGVVLDSWYVPLVTAAPELLLEFEGE